MSNLSYRIIRHIDIDLIDRFVDLRRILEEKGIKLQNFSWSSKFQPNQLFSDEDESLNAIFAAKDTLLTKITVSDATFSITADRPAGDIFDTITFTPGSSSDGKRKEAIWITIRSVFNEVRAEGHLAKILGVESDKYIEAWEHHQQQLESLSLNFTREITKFAVNSDQRIARKEEDLDQRYNEKYNELDRHYQSSKEKLESKEEELAQRIAEIDDRDNRHVRREISENFTKLIRDRTSKFDLSKNTISKRDILNVVLLVALVATLISLTLQLMYTSTDPSIYEIIRQIITALGFTGLLIYYIRWSNRWADQHAREEFRLLRLDLDMGRANWLVEMALEWQEKKGVEIPEVLLNQLSSNLFKDPDQPSEILHPADELASAIFGSATEINLPIGNNGSAKLGRKSINSLQKEQRR